MTAALLVAIAATLRELAFARNRDRHPIKVPTATGTDTGR